jgi:two-component system, NtrC family, nitrogen regulation sensor histidine kinase NtrY
MGYSHFQVRVTIQVALIVLVSTAAAFLIATTAYYATILLVLIVLGLQVAWLLHFVSRTNRDLSRFLLAIEHADFSQSFSERSGAGPFRPLAEAFERILQRFRDARSAKEEHASYLDTLVQHVPIAVLAVDATGRVELFNNAARRLLGVNALRNLHDLKGFGPELADTIIALEPGRPRLMKVMRDNELLQLNVSATALRLGGRDVKIVSLQDIRRELEAREVSAWQNLIRVLTHEIMNSVTPISSLAATAGEILDEARGAEDPRPAIDDAKDAVHTIAQRGSGLLRFVESYRRLTQVPAAKVERLAVAALFSRIRQLKGRELEARGIALTEAVAEEASELVADPGLLEQALLNLLNNAADAVAGAASPRIQLAAHRDSAGRPVLSVSDNGHGIGEDLRESIFVPFFTTKPQGTGVGLSIVQHIVRAHDGNVEVSSARGAGTEIRIRL